jgi:hypothetical protein
VTKVTVIGLIVTVKVEVIAGLVTDAAVIVAVQVLVSTDAKGGVYVAEVTGVPLVVIVPVPQPPVVGLVTRVKVTPPLLESFVIAAVMVPDLCTAFEELKRS